MLVTANEKRRGKSLPLGTRGDTDSGMPDCSAELVELGPCLAFVSDQAPNASQVCCDALEAVVMNAPTCLCELVEGGKNGTANTGLPPVNLTLVRQLPKDCGIQQQIHQDENHCRAAGYGTPAPSPDAPPGSTGSLNAVPAVHLIVAWSLLSSFAPMCIWLCSLAPTTLNAKYTYS